MTAPAGSRDKEVSLSLSLPGCAQRLPGEGRARQQGHTCCWTKRCDQGNRGPRRSSEQSAPQRRSAKGRRGDSGSLGEEGLDKSKGGSESWERCENTNLLQNTVLASPPRLLGTCGAHSSPAAPGTWHPAHGSADSAPPTARGTGSGNGAGCVRSCRRAITGKSRRQRARGSGMRRAAGASAGVCLPSPATSAHCHHPGLQSPHRSGLRQSLCWPRPVPALLQPSNSLARSCRLPLGPSSFQHPRPTRGGSQGLGKAWPWPQVSDSAGGADSSRGCWDRSAHGHGAAGHAGLTGAGGLDAEPGGCTGPRRSRSSSSAPSHPPAGAQG